MFPLYLQYLLTDFRQTFVTGASWDADDLITFLGQKVKVQGHAIAAEAHGTRDYRRVQLFLVDSSAVVITGFVQTLESPEIKTFRFPGLKSLGKRHRFWKTRKSRGFLK